MTRSAIITARTELIGMRVCVALATSHRSALELNVDQGQLHVRRLVAIGTAYGAMRTHQREACLRMIEYGHIVPALGRMAGLATGRLAGAVSLGHAFSKLALVNIFVTTYATKVLKVIQRNRRTRKRLMAVIACNRTMTARQWKT